MSSDCSPHIQEHKSANPHTNFAERVELLVMTIYKMTPEEFSKSHKLRHAEARFIVMSLLYQRNGFRSVTWLRKRYNISRTHVYYGLQQVNESPSLSALRMQIADELVEELEFEAFGFRDGKALTNDHHPRSNSH